METPFYGRNWDLPSRSRPSVREIPVQYVGSAEEKARPSRSESAVKIQKVFRGFLVRKSVKKINEIRSEVEEIQKRISKEETLDSIARDSQERLKFNEMLMRLLFKLDSVRGVDSGVRDFRKAVIRKAIALQEFLDSAFTTCHNNNTKDDLEIVEDLTEENLTAEEGCVDLQDGGITESLDTEETVEKQNDGGEALDVVVEPSESVGTSQTESQADSSGDPDKEENLSPAKEEENLSPAKEEENLPPAEEEDGEGPREDSRWRREELLEKMMQDNERMMEMMGQLFERNVEQTRLLSSLSQRVEQLERAFLCDRLRRKKKRNAAAGIVSGCETSLDNKKCGK